MCKPRTMQRCMRLTSFNDSFGSLKAALTSRVFTLELNGGKKAKLISQVLCHSLLRLALKLWSMQKIPAIMWLSHAECLQADGPISCKFMSRDSA